MKILLIDDSALSRTLLKRALGDEYTYIEAIDGMSGLEAYFVDKPDLVILDLTMPGMNGLDVLEQIRKMDPAARVIIGSADVQEFSRLQVLEMGAVAFISKPFQPASVREIVQNILTSPKANG